MVVIKGLISVVLADRRLKRQRAVVLCMRVTHYVATVTSIIIKHNDDFLSAYAHNDKILVSDQQEVKAGQEIAKWAAQEPML